MRSTIPSLVRRRWRQPRPEVRHAVSIGRALSRRSARDQRPLPLRHRSRRSMPPTRRPIPSASRFACRRWWSCCRARTPAASISRTSGRSTRGLTHQSRPALRRPRVAGRGTLESVLQRPHGPSDRQEQPPATRRLRLQPDAVVGRARRLRAVLREAMDRSVRELPAESASSPIRSSPTFRSAQIDPGPSNGHFPTDPFLVNGPTVNRALVDQVVPPGTLARNTAAVWLDTPDRVLPRQQQVSIGYERQLGRTVVVCGRLRAHGQQRHAAALQLQSGDQADHRAHRADHPRRLPRHRPATRA